MSTKLIDRRPPYYFLTARCFLSILGAFAIWWGSTGFSIFWQQSSLERLAYRILDGQSFKEPILAQQLPIIENIEKAAWCQPAALRSAAIIRLRMFEAGRPVGNDKHADDLRSLGNAIRRSLSCLPADPFLWLVLYGVESTQNATRPENLNYLRMSYQLGPNEGWIIVRRNPVAFVNFAALPADIAADAINEFLALVKSDMYQEAMEIFSGPAWQARDTILPHLATLPRRNREVFARVASDRGLGLAIPGIESPKTRP